MTGILDLCTVCSLGLKCSHRQASPLENHVPSLGLTQKVKKGAVVHSTKGFFTYKKARGNISLKDEG